MERLKLNIQRFATSGTLTTPNNTDGTSFYFTWSRQSYSIADNKSTIYWQIGINAAYSYQSNAVKLGPTTVNGTVIHSGGTYSNISRGTHTMFEGTMDIYHNPDGTKSFSASLSGWTWESTWTSADNSNNPFVLNTIPRYTTVSTWSVTSRTETSITLNWKTADTCSQIRYGKAQNDYTTANVNGNSGTVTISGLQAGQPYTLYFMPKRKDSSLWGDGSDGAWKSLANQSTYNYPELKSKSNFIIGNQLAMAIDNPLNRQMTISILGDDNSTIRTFSNTVGSYVITFTSSENDALYRSIPNKQKANYKVRVQTTVSDKTTTGGTYEINQDNCRPTFNNFTYADINSTTTALTGDDQKVIQGYSNIQATISVANKATPADNKGSTMSRYDLIIQGNSTQSASYSDNEDVTIVVNNANSGSIKVNAIDSRNVPKEVPKTATLIPYTNIQRGNITVTRAGNVGEATTLAFEGTMWSGDFGAVTNTITSVQYRYKSTASGSSWSAYTSLTPPTPSGNSYSFSGLIAGDDGNNGFTVENSFNIEVVVSDRLSSITFTTTLGTGVPHVAFGDNGIAIKQPYDTNESAVLQVNGTVKASNINFRNTWDANIEWKENGYGDKFRIIPDFNGTDDSNKLKVQGTVGGAGTDPTTWTDLMTISGKSGNVGVAKSIQIPKNSGAGYGLTNSDGSSIIRDWNNQNVTVDATGKDLYLGFQNTTGINILNGKATISSNGTIAGTAMRGKLETIDGRISNANITHTYENNKAHLQLLIASSSMTSNKPVADGFITHYSWDNNNKCSAQLYLPQGDQSTKQLQFRTENSSGTWTGWEDIYRAKTLYDNSSGTNGTVTISETSANFKHFVIYFRIYDGTNIGRSSQINSPNGKRVALSYVNSSGTTGWYKNKEYNISGTSITVHTTFETNLVNGSSTTDDRIFITKVVGYR